MSFFRRAAASDRLVVEAIKKQTATVIVAHGLGDSGAGWITLAENWRLRGKFEDVKFIFPNAPNIPITINMGMSMPGWYDISTFAEMDAAHDEVGILRSRQVFSKLIQDEIDAGIPSDKIVLGGFSQGAAMSLFTGITTPVKLAGVFGLSGYLVLGHKVKQFIEESKDANKNTPFFMGHGDEDQVVQYRWGQKTAEILQKQYGHQIDFRTYEGLPHSASLEEIDDLEQFITKCLSQKSASVGDKAAGASTSL